MQVKIIDRNLYNKAFLLLHVEEIVRLFILKPFYERKSNNFNKGTMDTPQMLLMKNTYFRTKPNPSIICENNQDNSLSIKGEYKYYLGCRMQNQVFWNYRGTGSLKDFPT